MSVFSKPLGYGRLGSYIGGGTAVGAGAGALMAGEDHRTAGAVVGGAVGAGLGTGMSAYHALPSALPGMVKEMKATGKIYKDDILYSMASQRMKNGKNISKWPAIKTALSEARSGIASSARYNLRDAAKFGLNVESDVLHGYGRAVSAVTGMMSHFRK